MNPRVLILAGGFGTRLASVVNDVPKPMAPIAGIPFLEYQIKYLRNQGFGRFTLLTGYKAESISDYFGDGSKFDVQIDYSIETEPLGTGGAIRKAALSSIESDFLILNGDGLFATDYRRFVGLATSESIALKYSTDLSRYGSVEIDDNFRIKTFIEKAHAQGEGYLNAGAYRLSRSFIGAFPEGKISIESDIFSKIAGTVSLTGIPCGGKFVDIGTPESFEWAQERVPTWIGEKFKPCLFLDRDGVLVKHVNYLHTQEQTELIPEVVNALKLAKEYGWYCIVITNQSGVGRGLFTADQCQAVHNKITEELAERDLAVDAFFACYDHPKHGVGSYLKESFDRKPKPGMALRACELFPIDLGRSVMMGDNSTDQLELPDLRTLLVQGDFGLNPVKPTTKIVNSHSDLLKEFETAIRGLS